MGARPRSCPAASLLALFAQIMNSLGGCKGELRTLADEGRRLCLDSDKLRGEIFRKAWNGGINGVMSALVCL